MKIPGKNSLFSGLCLCLSPSKEKQSILVTDKHEVFGLVSIDYSGINVSASLKAFFRPKSLPITATKKLISKIKPAFSLKKKKVLIVGGSRGLGAYLAKINAIFGANITLTYNVGKDDANEIATDIRNNGGIVSTKKLKIGNHTNLRNLDHNFDQVYYLATPKIYPNKTKNFDTELYKLYRSFYVDGFKWVIDHCLDSNKLPVVLFPSTIFIDEKKTDFREYIRAKLDGEMACKNYIKKMHLKVYYPRVPPLKTDQNLSIIPNKNFETAEEALSLIYMMNS